MPRLTAATLAVLAALALPAAAQQPQRQAPDSRQQITLSFAPIVKLAAPAVVNVYGSRRERARGPFDDPFFERFFGGGGGGGRERMAQSVGSGVIVSSDGFIVTNNHVVDGMTDLKVSLADRREFDVELKLRDQRTDLAVLKIKGNETFPALALGDSEALEVGDMVLAIGNPFGVGQTVTQGIVSALARTQVGITDYQFFIQTDAAINPGNSGGALVDMAGRLMGINTAIFSRSGGSHGIGFAIPANMVRTVIDSARGGTSTVRRPWLGASLQRVDRELAETLGLDRPTGALVTGIVSGSPAADAGLSKGDVILAVDGTAIDDPDSFGFRFATKTIGGTVNLQLLRQGRRILAPVKLIAALESRPRDLLKLKGRNPFGGATVMNLSPAVAEELAVETSSEGVVISEIEDNSPAQQVGFQKGDIIVTVNGKPVENTKGLESLTKDRVYLWRLQVKRGDQVFTSVFNG